MIDNVFVLGAGASTESGAPLMNEFLDVAEDLLVSGKFEDDSPNIQPVFELISNLQQVYAKSKLDLINMEALFGTIEMAGIVCALERPVLLRLANTNKLWLP